VRAIKRLLVFAGSSPEIVFRYRSGLFRLKAEPGCTPVNSRIWDSALSDSTRKDLRAQRLHTPGVDWGATANTICGVELGYLSKPQERRGTVCAKMLMSFGESSWGLVSRGGHALSGISPPHGNSRSIPGHYKRFAIPLGL